MPLENREPSPANVPYNRRDTRFALKPPLALSIHGDARPAMSVQLVNISRSGTAILADDLLGDPGVLLVLDLPDHTTSGRAPVPCELRWVLAENDVMRGRWLHGAQFGTIDARHRRLIDELVHRARLTAAVLPASTFD